MLDCYTLNCPSVPQDSGTGSQHTAATRTRAQAYLIVNADDYGYFPCVSRGIIDCARHGIVTATGILTTRLSLDEQLDWLGDVPQLDLGVHLSLTDGCCLDERMRKLLYRWDGAFPGKWPMIRAVLLHQIPTAVIGHEWRAQIRRCLDRDLDICFLNSHEHLHSLPALFDLVMTLAAEFGIEYVRNPRAEWIPRYVSPATLVRDIGLSTCAAVNSLRISREGPQLVGMAASGRLDIEYLTTVFRRLKSGNFYELMCHPGLCQQSDMRRSDLLAYHDWFGEHRTLTDRGTWRLCETHGVKLVGYRMVSNMLSETR